MRLPALIALLMIAGACSSHRPPAVQLPAPPRPGPRTEPAPPPIEQSATADAAWRAVEAARSLLETPYRYGGESRDGLDCSGLTTLVFQRLGIQLPRTAEAQADVGRWVAPDELRPGDLVFFGDSRDKPYHVGLVVSEAGRPLRMIHSATSQGVVETEVAGSSYWLRRFKFGRRVLPPE